MKPSMILVIFTSVLISSFQNAESKSHQISSVKESYLNQFTSKLVGVYRLAELLEVKGTAIMSPFGVFSALVNIHDKVWNVSTSGIQDFLGYTSEDQVAPEFAKIVGTLAESNISTKSVLYLRNPTKKPILPKSSKTEVVHLDFLSERHPLNQMISVATGGKLENKFVPESTFLGDAFYNFTVGIYLNTIHYKSTWLQKWIATGDRTFLDGLSVPFIKTSGYFPVKVTENYTSVAIPVGDPRDKEVNQYFVLILPTKSDFYGFVRSSFSEIFQDENPSLWLSAEKTVHVPAVSLTVNEQHYVSLKSAINQTFCYLDESTKNVDGRGPSFASPVVQTHHIQLAEDFIELASATGVSINSLEKGTHLTPASKPSSPGTSLDSEESSEIPGDPKRPKEKSDNSMIFNKPFVWYFYDKKVSAPIHIGAVNSLEKYMTEAYPPEGFEWLLDVHNIYYWNCP